MKDQPQKLIWWGEAPEQLFDLDGGAGFYSPTPGYAYALAEPRSIV